MFCKSIFDQQIADWLTLRFACAVRPFKNTLQLNILAENVCSARVFFRGVAGTSSSVNLPYFNENIPTEAVLSYFISVKLWYDDCFPFQLRRSQHKCAYCGWNSHRHPYRFDRKQKTRQRERETTTTKPPSIEANKMICRKCAAKPWQNRKGRR